MTKSKGVGRGRKGIRRGPTSVKDGKKLCNGPLHQEGVWLPATEAYFYVAKKDKSHYFYSVCRRCRQYRQSKIKTGAHGYVEISRVKNVFREIEFRIGRKEADRRLGFGMGRMRLIMGGDQKYVKAYTLERAVKLREELRRTGEIRSRRDIRHGNAMRGKKEIPVQQFSKNSQYYSPINDQETEDARRRQSRAITE